MYHLRVQLSMRTSEPAQQTVTGFAVTTRINKARQECLLIANEAVSGINDVDVKNVSECVLTDVIRMKNLSQTPHFDEVAFE